MYTNSNEYGVALKYGCILKVKTNYSVSAEEPPSSIAITDGTLYFIEYIDNSIMTLVSNSTPQKISTFHIDDTGKIYNKDLPSEVITAIQVIHIPGGGYAEQRGFQVEQKVKIQYSNGETLTGRITDVDKEKDSITIERISTSGGEGIPLADSITIPFNFSGVSTRLDIHKIFVIVSKQKPVNPTDTEPDDQFKDTMFELTEEEKDKIRQKSESGINMTESGDMAGTSTINVSSNEDQDNSAGDEYVAVYDIEQQINNYIEHMMQFKYQIPHIKRDMQRYFECIYKYSDINNGMKAIKLPENQLQHRFSKGLLFNLATPLVNNIGRRIFMEYLEETIPVENMFGIDTIDFENKKPYKPQYTNILNVFRDIDNTINYNKSSKIFAPVKHSYELAEFTDNLDDNYSINSKQIRMTPYRQEQFRTNIHVRDTYNESTASMVYKHKEFTTTPSYYMSIANTDFANKILSFDGFEFLRREPARYTLNAGPTSGGILQRAYTVQNPLISINNHARFYNYINLNDDEEHRLFKSNTDIYTCAFPTGMSITDVSKKFKLDIQTLLDGLLKFDADDMVNFGSAMTVLGKLGITNLNKTDYESIRANLLNAKSKLYVSKDSRMNYYLNYLTSTNNQTKWEQHPTAYNSSLAMKVFQPLNVIYFPTESYRVLINSIKNMNGPEITNSIMNNTVFNQNRDMQNINSRASKIYSMSEVIQESMLDGYKLYSYLIQAKNKHLKTNIDPEELESLIESINQNLVTAANSGALNEGMVNKQTRVVKTFETIADLNKTNNHIILKDSVSTDGNNSNGPSVSNTYEFMYNTMTNDTEFSGDLNEFVSKVRQLLVYSSIRDIPEPVKNSLFDTDNENKVMFDLLIDYTVKKNDLARVKENNTYYVYNATGQWVIESDFEDIAQNKRLLSSSKKKFNLTDAQREIAKEKIVEILNLVEQENISNEIRDEKSVAMKIVEQIRNLIRIKNNKIIKLLKYNEYKNKMGENIKSSGVLEHLITSPYSHIFNIISSMNEDDNQRHQALLLFVNKYTYDNPTDSIWLRCKSTNVQLVPKAFVRLSKAFLYESTEKYEQAMTEVCRKEGTISDQGDRWIHKYSGLTLRFLEFDNSLDFDEDGNPVVTHATLDSSNSNDLDISAKQDKSIQLSVAGTYARRFIMAFISMIGVSFKDDINTTEFFELIGSLSSRISTDLYVTSEKKKGNQVKPGKVIFMANVLVRVAIGAILLYVQCSGQTITKTFPGCKTSFLGYPLYDNSDGSDNTEYDEFITTHNVSGFNYLSCVLHSISKNNKSKFYEKFSRQSTSDIMKDIIQDFRRYSIKTEMFVNMLSKAKRIMKDKIESSMNKDYIEITQFEQPQRFKPSLYPLKTSALGTIGNELDNIKSKGFKSLYDKYIFELIENNYKTLVLEDIMTKLVHQETPITVSQESGVFVNNHCCNDTHTKSIISQYLTDKTNENAQPTNKQLVGELRNILGELKQSNTTITDIKNKLKVSHIHQKVTHFESIIDGQNMKETSIYSFFIKILNFDNKLPIPSYLTKYKFIKPNDSYDKYADINDKITTLKDQDIVFSNEIFNKILNTHWKHIYETNIVEHNDKKELELLDTPPQKMFKHIYKYVKNKDMAEGMLEDINEWKEELPSIKSDNDIEKRAQNIIGKSYKLKKSIIDLLNGDGLTKKTSKTSQLVSMLFDSKLNIDSIDTTEENVQSHIQFLTNLIHFSTTIYPQWLINNTSNTFDIIENVTCDHWKLAPSHSLELTEKHIEIFNRFRDGIISLSQFVTNKVKTVEDIIHSDIATPGMIELHERLKNLRLCPVYDEEFHKMNPKLHILYLLNKLIEIIHTLSDPTSYNIPNTLTVSSKEQKQLFNMIDIMVTSYVKHIMIELDTFIPEHETAYLRVFELKDIEKKGITDMFKNMNVDTRKAEYALKELKLGKWDFALNQTRVYKYSAKTYQQDKDIAQEILDKISPMEVMENEYYDNDMNQDPASFYMDGPTSEFASEGGETEGGENITDRMLLEDSDGLALAGEDDDYGEGMDGDEFY